MNDDPLFQVLMLGAGLFILKLWMDDRRAFANGHPNPKALPGATPAGTKAVIIGIVGALVLLAAETWGEIKLGIADEQSDMTALFALCTLTAAVVEEIIFRGFLVIEKRGRALLWAGVFAASVLFAALHPFLWDWTDGKLTWSFTAKGWFSTAAIFAGSLWFYAVRFASFNPRRSLLPCFAAHAAKNLGVIGVKAVQGHLVGWY
ncbi:CPBP family intramembrane metalloprotease [Nibricoccus aquaticus]|uniref:CPBP family intramembrane metalloprotease n=1 Tax=Nibricoccus aquaticus TaxID=2576891 RepID=A0A290Q7V6_9BACT|nr:CPBP family intramembrane glutamic endopeptidase [Nibricoccus aquaticus]ATC64513.1 CPBP family intramembrane metalloprotease [Nibricoccus aquaticus]